jgi:diadenosine tetraphosphate (Ap4A) HIT family hydrolase
MPETSDEWFERVSGEIARNGYRSSEWEQWPSWPFEGELRPKPLQPPEKEPPRGGTGGTDCFICDKVAAEDRSYLVWQDQHAILGMPGEPRALPFAAFLMPRTHADLADLPLTTAARMGELLTMIERAACDVLDVPRIQVARWGDGTEHLHWWLYARPTGMAQLRGTFLSHWDDILPPRAVDELRADLDLVAARLVELAGGEAFSA